VKRFDITRNPGWKVALRLPSGEVVTATSEERTHASLIERLIRTGHPDVVGRWDPEIEDGFVDSTGRFLTREEASQAVGHHADSYGRNPGRARKVFGAAAYEDALTSIRSAQPGMYHDMRNEMVPDPTETRRSLWVLPDGNVYEVDPHYHAEGLVEDLWSQAGFENVGFASLEDQLEYAYKHGAIRLIHDFDRSLGKPKRIWAAELDVRVPRWRERLRLAMMDLGLPRGTKIEIYDTAMDRRVPALVTNPSPAEMAVATATARAAGAVGRRALVPRRVLEIARPGQSILDFGAGPKAMHTMMLRDAGLDVTAHEFPANARQGVHDPDALRWQYDIVMASNVLNVQSSNAMLQETIDQLVGLKQPGGVIVANFPESPRKLPGASVERIEEYFRLRGLQPHRVGGTKQAPVWEIL